MQFQILPLLNTQKLDELPPRGHEDVHLEDLGIHPADDIANVRLSPADARCVTVEADSNPRRTGGTPPGAAHSVLLIGGHDAKSALAAGRFE